MAHLYAPRRDQMYNADGTPSLRYTKWIEEQTAATNDSVVDSSQTLINKNDIATNLSSINTINTELGDLIVITGAYTTSTTARIICNGALTVTLDPSPGDDTKMYIKRVNGTVTIDGNGKLIDGETSQILDVEYTTVLIVFSATLNAWYIM